MNATGLARPSLTSATPGGQLLAMLQNVYILALYSCHHLRTYFCSFCSDTGVVGCTLQACPDRCNLTMDAGTGDDRVARYFFNSDSRQCMEFAYSGDGGNDNRYSSVTDCLYDCNRDSELIHTHTYRTHTRTRTHTHTVIFIYTTT